MNAQPQIFSISEILLSPSISLAAEVQTLNRDVNTRAPGDTEEFLQRKSDIKLLMDKYTQITNIILLLKVYQFNDQINREDLNIVNDPIFESYIINSFIYDNKTFRQIVEDINLIKSDYLHTTCPTNTFKNFNPLDPLTNTEIKSGDVLEVLNGKCYERSAIYNSLIKGAKDRETNLPLDPITGQQVNKSTIKRMYMLLTNEQKTIVDNLNLVPNTVRTFFINFVMFLFTIIQNSSIGSLRYNEYNNNYNATHLTTKNNAIFVNLLIGLFILINTLKLFIKSYNNPMFMTQLNDYLKGRRSFEIETYE